MKTRSTLAILCASALLLGAACGGDTETEDNNTTANSGSNNGTNNDTDTSHPNVECDGEGVCEITGEITEDLTLTADEGTTWILKGSVFVGDDAEETVLTIEPGTTVFADATTDKTFLTIRRNSKLMAQGTQDAPIVFTPTTEEGSRERGLWGGIIINGKAPINEGDEAEGEGNTGKYGGSDPTDNSGTLEYVRVEFAGDLITSEDELNGIAFQGVGSGTTVDYVQVHMNSDDGVEFFGGTVNVKHLVLTGIGDDSMDWTSGWQGKAQFVVVQQYDSGGDRGIEADNLEDDNDATPRSHPMLSNVTLIGGSGADQDTGILLRRGTAANIYNAIVLDFGDACLDLDDAATFTNGHDGSDYTGDLTIENSIVSGCSTIFDEDDDEDGEFEEPFTVTEWFDSAGNNKNEDPMLEAPHSVDSPNFAPKDGSPALSASVQPDDDFFEAVDFIGAVGPDADWTAGWTIRTDK